MFIDININLPDNDKNVYVELANGIITGALYYSETGFEPVGVDFTGYGPGKMYFTSPVKNWKPLEEI